MNQPIDPSTRPESTTAVESRNWITFFVLQMKMTQIFVIWTSFFDNSFRYLHINALIAKWGSLNHPSSNLLLKAMLHFNISFLNIPPLTREISLPISWNHHFNWTSHFSWPLSWKPVTTVERQSPFLLQFCLSVLNLSTLNIFNQIHFCSLLFPISSSRLPSPSKTSFNFSNVQLTTHLPGQISSQISYESILLSFPSRWASALYLSLISCHPLRQPKLSRSIESPHGLLQEPNDFQIRSKFTFARIEDWKSLAWLMKIKSNQNNTWRIETRRNWNNLKLFLLSKMRYLIWNWILSICCMIKSPTIPNFQSWLMTFWEHRINFVAEVSRYHDLHC
jgi:hypothetical protein